MITSGCKWGPDDPEDGTTPDGDFDADEFNNNGQIVGGWFNGNPFNQQGDAGQDPPNQNLQVLFLQASVLTGVSVTGSISVFAKIGDEVIEFDNQVVDCFATGGCEPADCDDGNACTDDECVDKVCVNTPIDCNDDDACTDDGCDPANGCTHDEVDCDDDDACTDDGCDPANGCTHDDVNCDDGDRCTDDGCDPANACAHDPADGLDGQGGTSGSCIVPCTAA